MVEYEWCIEKTDENNDIIDNDFSSRLRQFCFPLNDNEHLVLVRSHYKNGYLQRTWAYVNKHTLLPDYFDDCYQVKTTLVPKRFKVELISFLKNGEIY
jgi:hypothetical protein